MLQLAAPPPSGPVPAPSPPPHPYSSSRAEPTAPRRPVSRPGLLRLAAPPQLEQPLHLSHPLSGGEVLLLFHHLLQGRAHSFPVAHKPPKVAATSCCSSPLWPSSCTSCTSPGSGTKSRPRLLRLAVPPPLEQLQHFLLGPSLQRLLGISSQRPSGQRPSVETFLKCQVWVNHPMDPPHYRVSHPLQVCSLAPSQIHPFPLWFTLNNLKRAV